MSSLKDKVAIVTGSSRGIGRATAERLGREGAKVVVSYIGNADKAQEVVNTIEQAGSEAIAVKVDVSSAAAVHDLFAQALERFGGLDIVVNTVGAFVFKPLVAVSEAEYDQVFGINTKGVFFVLKEAAQHVRDGGRIINLSSGATVTPSANSAIYAGSKAAAEQLISALSKELGSRQITVNTVMPGLTNTDGMIIPQEYIAQMISQTTLGRLGEPADVADVIAFLVGNDGRWVTGQIIRAGGGLM